MARVPVVGRPVGCVRWPPVRRRIVAALHDAGAGLLAGTDAGIEIVLTGSALHDELAEFVAAGLTPYEALRAVTVDAAEFLRAQGEFGSLAAGARADLFPGA